MKPSIQMESYLHPKGELIAPAFMSRFHTLLLLILLTFIVTPAQAAKKKRLPDLQTFHQRAEAKEPLTVVFFGGSLTYGANASDPLKTSWRGLMQSYLQKKYPNTPFTFYDAAIGGTGSNLGIFRLDRDVLPYKPDLVFLDFTMNDGDDGDVQTVAAYERLVRQILSADSALFPVITCFKYHTNKPDGPLPQRVVDHLKIAEAYHLPVANILSAMKAAVKAGEVQPDALWSIEKDGAHPGDPGYRFFFDVVRESYEKAIQTKHETQIPKPVFADLYPEIRRHKLVDLPEYPTGWKPATTYRTSLWFDGLSSRWMDRVLAASATENEKPAPLEVKFRGTLVGLIGERDSVTPPFRVWIDGKPITAPKAKPEDENIWRIDTSSFSPVKAGTGNLFGWTLLSKNLEEGEHTLRIEPLFDNADPKAQLRIESVCSAGR